MSAASLGLQRGEWAVVRSAAEILATLDAEGRLDGVPFMPEMLRFCGKRIRVGASAHKTCDTITGQTRALRMDRTVHLADARCDGSAHGGCQAACLLFWKEAWLQRVEPAPFAPLWRLVANAGAAAPAPAAPHAPLAADDLARLAVADAGDGARPRRYRCQATEVLAATRPIPWWEPTQYLADWLSGNVPLRSLLASAFLRVLAMLVLWGPGRKPKRRVYDFLADALGHPRWPYENGRVVGKTPGRKLDLVPGERVRVRSHEEILDTLAGRVNRGMGFAPEMVGYCDGTYTVRARIERILDEKTGAMLEMKSECIALEDVVCRSNCSSGRMFCPRGVVAYWREIWLDRAERDA